MTVYAVAVYEVSMAHGGNEEGGWWYDVGDLCVSDDFPLPLFTSDEQEAINQRGWMESEIERLKLNEGRRPKSSVLSTGVYEAHIVEGKLPEHFPEQRPQYE